MLTGHSYGGDECVREAKRLKDGQVTPLQLTDLGDREHQKNYAPRIFTET
jgi:hypothetical protein